MLSTKKKSRIQEIKGRKYVFDQEKSRIQENKVRKHVFDQEKKVKFKK